jgi:hypothetical protein
MQSWDDKGEADEVDYVAVLEALDVRPDGVDVEQTVWILDAVPCSTLDRLSIEPDRNTAQELPLIDFFLLTLQQAPGLPTPNAYLQVTVSLRSSGDDDEIRAFATGLNGIDNNNVSYFVRIRKTPPAKKHVKTLEELSRFTHVSDTKDLATFYPSTNGAAVAVYDVGQGSMSALVDEHEHPLMFFDLGWPLSLFPKSVPATYGDFNPFPAALQDKAAPTPVVLSHLDWDHWAYAYKSGTAKWDSHTGAWKTIPAYRTEALERPWLMRRPDYRRHKLTGSHIHFVQTLGRTLVNGQPALHFWPKGRRSKQFGQITYFACNPTAGSPKKPAFLRNNQGLGMLINDAGSGARVLLAGDADFPSIPPFAKKRLTGMVATHHGGKVTAGSIPVATGHGRMVISAYPGSYKNIPHPDVEAEAERSGWRIAYTSERKDCFRHSKNLKCGNRLIRLGQTPMCGCSSVPEACLCISQLP